jgi:enoyl-CoA hydratase/carnithine racemase
MRLIDRHATPQSEGAVQTMRQVLSEVHDSNNPVVAATAAMIVGIGIGFALSSLLATKDDEIKRLRADADDLKRRIETLRH